TTSTSTEKRCGPSPLWGLRRQLAWPYVFGDESRRLTLNQDRMTARASANRRAALFCELFAAHAAYVHRTLFRFGVPPADAEDVTHDVFLTVYERLDELDPARSPRPWLAGFAYYAAANYRRRVKTRAEVPDTCDEVAELQWPGDPELDLELRRQQE